jgi:hypothetical protein
MTPGSTTPGGIAPLPEGCRRVRLSLRQGALLWLQVVEAVSVFVLVGVYTASRSPLGRYLSAGESPLFVWSRTHAVPLFWGGLGVTLLICALRAWASERRPVLIQALIYIEVAALGAMAFSSLRGDDGILGAAHVGFQASLVLQVIGVAARAPGAAEASARLLVPERRLAAFLSFSFVLAGAPALFDPGVHRIRAFTEPDSAMDIALSFVLPPLLSGSTGVWLGIGVAGLFAAAGAVARRAGGLPQAVALPLTFVSVAGLYATVFIASLTAAIPWEIGALGLDSLTLPLGLLLAGALGGLTHLIARRLFWLAPVVSARSSIGVAALSAGAVLVLPLAWILTRPGAGRGAWRGLLGVCLLAPVALGGYVLYGGLFDPWFTVSSYLKAILFKAAATAAAGILVLVDEEIMPARTTHPAPGWRAPATALATALLLTAAPIAAFDRRPETKAAVLQFSEFSMVDATYLRVLSRLPGVGDWIRLGQSPSPNGSAPAWPRPWTLQQTHRSLLPRDFNLVVVVVDALRGDAFRSAGYDRNLTPFLDRWALQEAVSFRRAYSPGGGTFAAFPFLVGGRSRFTLYGPGLHEDNLYFKLAQAEGIQRVMVVKGYGPRAIFPPDYPVVELGDGGGRGRSAPADEVFGWLQAAVDARPAGERFLAFLHVMDVHNDLWKKSDGLDFGDAPRDLYDNNLSYLDRAVGRFVAWLKRRGLYDRTVILFTSDHGEQFWEHGASLHGHTLYEEDLRIPVILLAHGVRARVEDVPVTSADMAPTILDLAGYSVSPPYDDPRMGISLVPLLLGQDRGRYLHRDVAGRASFKRSYFLYRDWRWKLIYSADFDLLQLFDVVDDPRERRNLVRERQLLAVDLERELINYLAKAEGRSYRPLLSSGDEGAKTGMFPRSTGFSR